jgi:hypothetical protein
MKGDPVRIITIEYADGSVRYRVQERIFFFFFWRETKINFDASPVYYCSYNDARTEAKRSIESVRSKTVVNKSFYSSHFFG